MALPEASFLSDITEFVRGKLSSALFAIASDYQVIVDKPSGVQKLQSATPTRGFLNLFFYRFDAAGYFPQESAHERWVVRARCLVTPFSIDGKEGPLTVAAGQVDLRLLGSVMRYFHENPVLKDQARKLQLQIVPEQLSSEEINQIWMSQHDVAYRPSLLYEFGLLPIEPKAYDKPIQPVVAGGISTRVNANLVIDDSLPHPAPQNPQSPYMEIAAGPDWSPLISFVVTGAAGLAATQARSATPGVNLDIWVAGHAGQNCDVVWQRELDGRWVDIVGGPQVALPNTTKRFIDPGFVSQATTLSITAPAMSGNYLLFLERMVGGKQRRSNPLILKVA